MVTQKLIFTAIIFLVNPSNRVWQQLVATHVIAKPRPQQENILTAFFPAILMDPELSQNAIKSGGEIPISYTLRTKACRIAKKQKNTGTLQMPALRKI